MRETWRNTLPENVQRASAETVREQAGEAGSWSTMEIHGKRGLFVQGWIGAEGS